LTILGNAIPYSPVTTLATDFDINGTTATVTNINAFGNIPLYAVITAASNVNYASNDPSDYETILVQGKSGNDLTNIIRGVEGLQKSWITGDFITIFFTATEWNGVKNHVSDTVTAHGAVSESTPYRLIVRDSAGRAKVAQPSHDDDIVNKIFFVTNTAAYRAIYVDADPLPSEYVDGDTILQPTNWTVDDHEALVPVSLIQDVHGLFTNKKIIADTGANSDGYWMLFTDGTQICHHYVGDITIEITDLNNGVYRSNQETWTFPRSFSSSDGLFVGVGQSTPGNFGTWVTAGASSTTLGRWRAFRNASGASVSLTRISLTAIGRSS